jgi:hypothetical protein
MFEPTVVSLLEEALRFLDAEELGPNDLDHLKEVVTQARDLAKSQEEAVPNSDATSLDEPLDDLDEPADEMDM